MSVPVVPLSAFSNLSGPALAGDLRRLVASPDHTGLVLFSDTLGEQLAILPLGPGQRHGRIQELAGAEIEGLRPLCGLHLRGEREPDADDERAEELARLENDLKERERDLAEAAQALSERESLLEQREQMLLAKERDFFRSGGELARRTSDAPARLAAEARG